MDMRISLLRLDLQASTLWPLVLASSYCSCVSRMQAAILESIGFSLLVERPQQSHALCGGHGTYQDQQAVVVVVVARSCMAD